MPLTAHILTLFPEVFPGCLGVSIHGEALKKGLWKLNVINIRDFATDKHKTVDDTPYGGGAGMVLKPDVLGQALETLPKGTIIYALSPRGAVFTQARAQTFSHYRNLALICGRYEGIDERVIEHFGIEELSIGDFVLSGGEVAAQVVLEAVIRLIPGVVGNQETLGFESHSSGLLEYPHYTKPQTWALQKVPDVLLSGNHGQIAQWRLAKSEEITKKRRPDLWHIYKKNNKK